MKIRLVVVPPSALHHPFHDDATMSGASPSDNVDPLQLSGLRQAVFVLKCFDGGLEEPEIVGLFKGDEQLVAIWRTFLIHNHWLERANRKVIVTEKGKGWIRKYK